MDTRIDADVAIIGAGRSFPVSSEHHFLHVMVLLPTSSDMLGIAQVRLVFYSLKV